VPIVSVSFFLRTRNNKRRIMRSVQQTMQLCINLG
jgi:hypothetical protein